MGKLYHTKLLRNQYGFTLIELLIYLAIVGVIMTLVLTSFTGILSRSGQQSRIAGTQIESGIGLDIIRRDLEHAGYGLPWQWQNPGAINYAEPAPFSAAPNGIPAAFSSSDNSATSVNSSDYLVIRATNIALGATTQKWGFLGQNASHSPQVESMNQGVPFDNTDRFIVLDTESGNQFRQLIMNSGAYFTTQTAVNNYAPAPTPNDPNGIRYIVYGLKTDNLITRPFHRVDYFISAANVPTQCAPGTGVLGKLQINQANNLGVFLPLVDCVADFQIVYYLDTNGDGSWDTRANANAIATLTTAGIRNQLKRVACFILAHEGTRDRTYTQPGNIVNVGETNAAGVLFPNGGRTFDLAALVGGNWANYRWKVYSLAVNPKNLQ